MPHVDIKKSVNYLNVSHLSALAAARCGSFSVTTAINLWSNWYGPQDPSLLATTVMRWSRTHTTHNRGYLRPLTDWATLHPSEVSIEHPQNNACVFMNSITSGSAKVVLKIFALLTHFVVSIMKQAWCDHTIYNDIIF